MKRATIGTALLLLVVATISCSEPAVSRVDSTGSPPLSDSGVQPSPGRGPDAVQAATGRFGVEDMLRLKRLSEYQLSPDGSRVAFVVTDVSLEENSRTNHIWIAPVSGGEGVRMLEGDEGEASPQWSPDGKSLAFTSARDGSTQVWIAEVDAAGRGGGLRKLTDTAMEAGGPRWSPDGKWILFTSDVYPECDTLACSEKMLAAAEKSPTKARIIEGLLFRHWTAWKDGRFTHLFIVPSTGSSEPRDLTPGRADVPPFSLGGPDDYAFSPDSREVAFARKTDPVEAISTNSDIFVIDALDPKTEPKLVTSNKGADGGPAYSPDGRYIAYRSQSRAGFESDRWRLMLYDRKSGTHRSISDDIDRSFDGYAWTRDAQRIFATAEEQGSGAIYTFDLASGKATLLDTGDGSSGDVRVTPDGGTILFTKNSLKEPSDLYQADASGANVQPITRLNDGTLRSFNLAAGEEAWYEGAGGTRIHAWIVKPADFDEGRRYPLLFLVHGGPQGAWNDAWSYRWNPQVFANAGYVVFMPNPRGSTGFGQLLTDEISGDWGGKVYEDLMKGADYAESLPYVDASRTTAAGASYGGYMMNWFLGHTKRFRAIVSHAGVYNLTSMYGVTEELWFPEWDLKGMPWTNRELYRSMSPHTYAENFSTPTLVTHGELDFRVPIGEGFQLFTTLQRLGVPSKMIYFPDEGHWINKPANSALWYRNFIEWMDRWTRQQ